MVFDPLSPREGIVLSLLILSHAGRVVGWLRKDRREEKKGQREEKQSVSAEWLAHVNAREAAWRHALEDFQEAYKRSHKAELRCEERCTRLEERNAALEARDAEKEERIRILETTVGELSRQILKRDEAIMVLHLEDDIRKANDRRKSPRPNGGTPSEDA